MINILSSIPKSNIRYQDDSTAIICGDCMDILPKLPNDSINLVLTDPPYNIGDSDKLTKVGNVFKTNKEAWGEWDKMDEESYLQWIKKIVNQSFRILKNSGSLIMFFDKFNITYLRDFGKQAGFHPVNFYALVKRNPVPNLRKNGFTSGFELSCIFNKNKKERTWNFLRQNEMQNYFLCNIGNKETNHPTEKPITAFKRLIQIHTNPGDVVLDPFLGSGTSACACKELGRKCIGIELNPSYVDIAVKRLQNTMIDLF